MLSQKEFEELIELDKNIKSYLTNSNMKQFIEFIEEETNKKNIFKTNYFITSKCLAIIWLRDIAEIKNVPNKYILKLNKLIEELNDYIVKNIDFTGSKNSLKQ